MSLDSLNADISDYTSKVICRINIYMVGFLLLTVCISHVKLATTHFLLNPVFCIFF